MDLESLGINEDDFEDLQSLFEVVFESLVSVELNYSSFQLFDRDRDGILTIKEVQMLLRCLGLKPDLEQERDF